MLEGSVVQVIKENRPVEWVSCEDPISAEIEFVKMIEKNIKGFEDWPEEQVKRIILQGRFDIPGKDLCIVLLDLDSDSEEIKELEKQWS